MKVLVISDNHRAFLNVKYAIETAKGVDCSFDYARSFEDSPVRYPGMFVLDMNKEQDSIIKRYQLILSVHCKQIFPEKIVKSVRCVNVHPGFCPDNKGWYPHIFSIVNGKRAGVTIHEMDDKVDNGGIICQSEVTVNSTDTSYEVYGKILNLEFALLDEWLERLLTGDYKIYYSREIGNFNTKELFKQLKQLDLNNIGTLQEHINLLRALSHNGHKNAYFIENNERKYIEIKFL